MSKLSLIYVKEEEKDGLGFMVSRISLKFQGI